jgi:acyl-CoA thioesterase II
MIDAKALMERVCPTAEGDHWTMTADRALSLGPPGAKHISGGAQLAAMVALLEQQTGQRLIQAACQFRGSPLNGESFELHVDHIQRGRNITLAEASLVADGNLRAKAVASLGSRPDIGAHQWLVAPVVPEPDECRPLPFIQSDPGDLHRHLDVRIAREPDVPATGELVFWVGWNGAAPVPAAFLTVIADYLPEALHFNLERPAGATSLDNVIRIFGADETAWLLCHTQLSGVSDGLFHGTMAIYSQAGKLLACASQSGVVRLI